MGRRIISLLLNVRDVRQIETHIAEPFVPDPNHFEFQIPNAKLKRHKSPSSDKIPEKLIQTAGG
jgi:hypothetical protein